MPDEQILDAWRTGSLHSSISRMLEIRGEVFAEFEKWKGEAGIKDSQDVEVEWSGEAADLAILGEFGDDLANLFKMARVSTRVDKPSVTFRASPWPKCERSRLRREDVAKVVIEGEEFALTARDRRALGV